MARAIPDPTPIQAFLAPLTRLARHAPTVEALVFWEAAGWPDAASEALEAEEMAFYAEGLLEEGFRLDWRILARPDAPGQADHVRLYLWEAGADGPPEPGPDWQVVQRDQWPQAAA